MESHLEAQRAERFQAASVTLAGRKWGSWEEAQRREGGRQVKRTGFPEATSLRANNQLQSIKTSRAASSRAWLPVCGASQTAPWGAALALPSSMWQPERQAGHRQAILPGVRQLDWEKDASLHASLPACKSCPPPPSTHTHTHTHPALRKAHPGAGLGTAERGCPGKPRTWGLILVSGWNILHTPAGISNRPTQRWKMQPLLTWLALIRGNSAWQRCGILSCRFSRQQRWRVTLCRVCYGWDTSPFWLFTVAYA